MNRSIPILGICVCLAGCAQKSDVVQSWSSYNGMVETKVHRVINPDRSKTFTWIVTNNTSTPFCIAGEVSYATGAATIDDDRVVVVFPRASLPIASLTSIPGEKVSWSYIAIDFAWLGEGGVPCRLNSE